MKPGKVQEGKDSQTVKTSAASAPYSLPGKSGGRSISKGKEKNMNILELIECEVFQVSARRNIYPNPLEDDGRIVRRGEMGEIQDESDGFFYVEFSDGYIAMCDKSELEVR